MENEGEIEKSKPSKEKGDRGKSIGKKMATAALIFGLSAGSGGCSVGEDSKQRQTEPLSPDSIEEVSEVDIEKVDSVEIPSKEKNVFSVPIEADDSFNINLHDDVVRYINSVYAVEGEEVKYSVFEEKKGQNHFEKVASFINSLVGEDIEHNPDYVELKVPGGEVFYGSKNQFLTFDFETPIQVPGVSIVPESKESIEEGLKKITSEIVDGGFEHKVDKIVKEGDYYIVSYRRLLDDVPIYTLDNKPHLVLSQEGKLKGGGIWLKEFDKVSEVGLLSGEEFMKKVNMVDYPKTFSYGPASEIGNNTEVLDTALAPKYVRTFHQPGAWKSGGLVNISKAELVYYFSHLGEKVLPTFYLGGEGYQNVPEASAGKFGEKREIISKVLANAMSSEYVKK